MPERVWGMLALAVVAGLALTAAGQVDGIQSRTRLVGNSARQAKLPYTAEFKTTNVRTLANGSTITRETTEIMARDSQGRTLTSTTSTAQIEGQTVHTSVNVNDPVAKTLTYWSTPGQRVTVRNQQEQGAAGSGCAANTLPPMPHTQISQREKPKMEDLGTQTFEGVEAQGHRTTRTIPVSEIGNSDALVRVDEVWFSTTPGLSGINMRQVVDDPQAGKSTRELVKFTPGEPDPALFQAPQDFELVTEEIHNEVRCPQ